jgi:hypothetical protein
MLWDGTARLPGAKGILANRWRGSGGGEGEASTGGRIVTGGMGGPYSAIEQEAEERLQLQIMPQGRPQG